nr:immunoglobulin heavy chain junction region [Mus musculus]
CAREGGNYVGYAMDYW